MDPSIIFGALLGAVMFAFLLVVRMKDLPKPAPASPFQHLDERKASIYENLRDLQFEYRLDKLSDADYQASKLQLQKELAQVMAETDRIKAEMGVPVGVPVKVAAPPSSPSPSKKTNTCPACGATFDKPLKFCGECGKAMGASA